MKSQSPCQKQQASQGACAALKPLIKSGTGTKLSGRGRVSELAQVWDSSGMDSNWEYQEKRRSGTRISIQVYQKSK